MTVTSPHIIRHVTLDLQYTGKVNGWEIQEEAKQWLDALFINLEPELEKISGDKSWLSLDTLDIEINVKGDGWKEDAINRATNQIMDKLQSQRQKMLEKNKQESPSPKQHFSEILLHYLQHGHLPWNADSFSVSQWEREVENLFVHIEATFFITLFAILKENAAAIQRLVRAVSTETILHVLQNSSHLMETEQQKNIHDVHTLMAVTNGFQKNEALKNSIITYVFYTITGSEKLAVPVSLLQNILLDKAFEKILPEQVFTSKAFNSLQEISLLQMPVAQAKAKIEKDVYAHQKNVFKSVNTTNDNTPERKNIKEELFTHEQRDGIYLSNAGLVIIAAYLPRLFENLGWWKNNKWKDRNAAVCLVQYLATGQPEMEEFELVFPKVLCGLQPEDIIDPTFFLLTDKIKDEAKDLLSSVITYWSVLKDTSIDGLRGSFLVRDGKLWKNENKWYLTVEQKGYDMLLQQLPWNISMIQLPWMDEMLTTNWV